MQDLSAALREVDAGGKIDVLYMHACLMGTIEGAYQVRDFVDYYVSSQHWLWGPGGVNYLDNITTSSGPEDVATAIALDYSKTARGEKPFTISVARMSKLPELIDNLNLLAGLLKAEMSLFANPIIRPMIMAQVQRFDDDDFDITVSDELIDLYDFARLVHDNFTDPQIKSAAQAIMETLGEADCDTFSESGYVMYECHESGEMIDGDGVTHQWTHDGSNGVSIFYPDHSRSFYVDDNLDFASGTSWGTLASSIVSASGQDVSWGSMLVEYIRYTNPNAPDEPDPSPLVAPLRNIRFIYLPMVAN